jgi:hypothetical protein
VRFSKLWLGAIPLGVIVAVGYDPALTSADGNCVEPCLGGGGVAGIGEAGRLLKAFAIKVEPLRRLQHGASQYLRVEHVYIHEGGQAVIGDVRARGGDREGARLR